MIKISHEVPLVLLKPSRSFNDYDYALVHLFEIYPEYLEFFKESLKMGREVLLDNSIFELKEAFEEGKFANWVEELEPTRYIIPDVLDDCARTMINIESWNRNYPFIKGNSIGVVQGKNYQELTRCYEFINQHCDEIAICFPHSHHQSEGLSKNQFEDRMKNRQLLIERWLREGVINKEKRHHLLGCLLPQEFKAYKNYDWIYSLDTSNPVLHGIKGILYEEGSLSDKVNVKMADIMAEDIDSLQCWNVLENIRQFKNNIS